MTNLADTYAALKQQIDALTAQLDAVKKDIKALGLPAGLEVIGISNEALQTTTEDNLHNLYALNAALDRLAPKSSSDEYHLTACPNFYTPEKQAGKADNKVVEHPKQHAFSRGVCDQRTSKIASKVRLRVSAARAIARAIRGPESRNTCHVTLRYNARCRTIQRALCCRH
jgi:hypothetical protein